MLWGRLKDLAHAEKCLAMCHGVSQHSVSAIEVLLLLLFVVLDNSDNLGVSGEIHSKYLREMLSRLKGLI